MQTETTETLEIANLRPEWEGLGLTPADVAQYAFAYNYDNKKLQILFADWVNDTFRPSAVDALHIYEKVEAFLQAIEKCSFELLQTAKNKLYDFGYVIDEDFAEANLPSNIETAFLRWKTLEAYDEMAKYPPISECQTKLNSALIDGKITKTAVIKQCEIVNSNLLEDYRTGKAIPPPDLRRKIVRFIHDVSNIPCRY